jgi:hypothetical protein
MITARSAQVAFVIVARNPAVGDTSLGRRYRSPIGGITKFPIKASASAKVCWMQLPSARLAMFSFAAISQDYRGTNQLATGLCYFSAVAGKASGAFVGGIAEWQSSLASGWH